MLELGKAFMWFAPIASIARNGRAQGFCMLKDMLVLVFMLLATFICIFLTFIVLVMFALLPAQFGLYGFPIPLWIAVLVFCWAGYLYLILKKKLRFPSMVVAERRRQVSKDMELLHMVTLILKVLILAICVFFWIGTFYTLGQGKELLPFSSSIAVIFSLLFFFINYKVLGALCNSGKAGIMGFYEVLALSPIVLVDLWHDTNSFVILAGYYIGLVVSDVIFFYK